MTGTDTLALSFVIPLYKSAETIAAVVREIESLQIDGGHEIVLVNDGSDDRTGDVCRGLVAAARVPITYLEHARNYGEHNAVLTGWRHARGRHIVNLDDDGQNPPEEARRLWVEAKRTGLDVIFGHYVEKRHSVWRNIGSRFTNKMTDWALDKPAGFYLSSFRCVTSFVARQVVTYAGPYPYIDGLILQVTQRIGSITVRHDARRAGTSTYTLRRLVRLWLSAWVNFSVLPLRVATVLGLILAGAGVIALGTVGYLWLQNIGPGYGFGWLMAALLVFSGTQLVLLGLIGEYVGRMFLAVNQRPQSVVRETIQAPDHRERMNVSIPQDATLPAVEWESRSDLEGVLKFGDRRVHVCLPDRVDEKPNSANDFVLLKTPTMVEEFIGAARAIRAANILELGVFRGGSVVAYSELLKPRKLVAIDLLQPRLDNLNQYIQSPEVRGRVAVHLGVNQADHQRLATIMSEEFAGAPLDIVVDDASHFLHETREAFKALFPRLRPGGLYVIEDWAWAHWPGEPWQADRGGDYFKGKEPLSTLVVELMALCASRPGLIERVLVKHSSVVIVKGPEVVAPGFEPASLWLNRGEPLPRFQA